MAEADQERKERMKHFPDTYNDAHEQAKKYTLAPRAGWVEPGKRTKDNQAILVRRQEAVQLADDLAQACYGEESMNHAQIDILGEKIVDSFAGGGEKITTMEELERKVAV